MSHNITTPPEERLIGQTTVVNRRKAMTVNKFQQRVDTIQDPEDLLSIFYRLAGPPQQKTPRIAWQVLDRVQTRLNTIYKRNPLTAGLYQEINGGAHPENKLEVFDVKAVQAIYYKLERFKRDGQIPVNTYDLLCRLLLLRKKEVFDGLPYTRISGRGVIPFSRVMNQLYLGRARKKSLESVEKELKQRR